MHGRNFVSNWKNLEQYWKHNCQWAQPSFAPFFHLRYNQNGTEYEPCTSSRFQRSFQHYFLVWPYHKHLINKATVGQSLRRILTSVAGTDLVRVCTGYLAQDSPTQTSHSVNNNIILNPHNYFKWMKTPNNNFFFSRFKIWKNLCHCGDTLSMKSCYNKLQMKPYLYGCLYHVFVPWRVAWHSDVNAMASFPVSAKIVLLMKLELKNNKTICWWWQHNCTTSSLW